MLPMKMASSHLDASGSGCTARQRLFHYRVNLAALVAFSPGFELLLRKCLEREDGAFCLTGQTIAIC
jgi:hypothetical protein